ncbi:unnamed protein product [Moneuplotes crassus]|uniref:Histidine phosphatase family protein n=1 Tax=Euplotes crassus TaxID=5936 RepID=A0AAD1XIQ1_EUPCR|nr:unnamed protein product [Moneuplotes crassus]
MNLLKHLFPKKVHKIGLFWLTIAFFRLNLAQVVHDSAELEALKQGSQVILLRHANSEYNFEYGKMSLRNYSIEDERILRVRKDLRDAPLSDLGLQQCKEAQPMANRLDVGYVFVSPMKRALETAYNVFLSHPNFDNIKFIVLPMLKEAIDTTCDIPMNIKDTISDYRNKFKKFDTSEVEKYSDQEHYFLRDIDLEFSKKISTSKIYDPSDPIGSNAYDLLLDEIDRNYPNKIEKDLNILKRVALAKNHIKEFITTTSPGDDSKIILVGHSYYFKMWTAQWENPLSSYGNDLPPPSKSTFLQNCQFFSDNASFPSTTRPTP